MHSRVLLLPPSRGQLTVCEQESSMPHSRPCVITCLQMPTKGIPDVHMQPQLAVGNSLVDRDRASLLVGCNLAPGPVIDGLAGGPPVGALGSGVGHVHQNLKGGGEGRRGGRAAHAGFRTPCSHHKHNLDKQHNLNKQAAPTFMGITPTARIPTHKKPSHPDALHVLEDRRCDTRGGCGEK